MNTEKPARKPRAKKATPLIEVPPVVKESVPKPRAKKAESEPVEATKGNQKVMVVIQKKVKKLPTSYNKFVGESVKAGKSFAEAVQEWNKRKAEKP